MSSSLRYTKDVTDSACSLLWMKEENIATSEADVPFPQRKSPADVETSYAPNNDGLDETDMTTTIGAGKGQAKDQQPSTGQITSACFEDTTAAAAAGLSQRDDSVGVVSPNDASKFVLGFPPNKQRTMGIDALCAPSRHMVDDDLDETDLTINMVDEKIATSEGNDISKAEFPLQQRRPPPPEPALIEEQSVVMVEVPNIEMYPDEPMMNPADEPEEHRRYRIWLVKAAVGRFKGVLELPVVLIFGVILYLLDIGSDIAAGVVYFQKGHPFWGLLTITFVLLSAICWATVSWTWWYCYCDDDTDPTYRRKRMVLSVLLLDPLVRYDIQLTLCIVIQVHCLACLLDIRTKRQRETLPGIICYKDSDKINEISCFSPFLIWHLCIIILIVGDEVTVAVTLLLD